MKQIIVRIENMKNDFFDNFKNSKIITKHQKSKFSKNSKSQVRGPKVKTFGKKIMVRNEKC
jgi:hypothetical protein